MASQYNSVAPLPQGFSVYQPQLGAQLQFFPALGTQELDDMMNAYIPGSAPLKEKRATISLDFLEHTQLTGQTFKFYPVYYSSSPVAPVAASPVNSIATSSFSNTSPVNSTWDWSQTSASPSTSSRSSIPKSRKASKAGSLASRYSTADLSHLPGMKIMTKDGQDVTDSASRGSKTKEQRDHAHLMRIIKACDSCRRKKIRCDPSHKKRSAPQAQPQSTSKPAKKARTTVAATPPQKPVAAVDISRIDENPGISMSLFGLDPTFTFTGLDSLEPTDQMCETWEEFVQYPPADVEENYDFFLDPEGYLSSQSSASSSSASPPKALTPASQQELLVASGLEEREGVSSESTSPQLPFLQENHAGSVNNYTDFNLFSPSSSFSEDDRMVLISSMRLLSPSQLSVSGSEMLAYDSFDADGQTLSTDWSGPSAPVSPLETDLVAAADANLSWYDPGHGPGSSRERDSLAGISVISPTGWVGGVRIAYPPGGSVTVTAAPGSGMEMIANSDTSVEVAAGPSTSTTLQLRDGIQDESRSTDQSPTERGRLRSEPSVDYSSQLLPGQAIFRTVRVHIATVTVVPLTTNKGKQESTSASTIAPSTMATAANNSVEFSTRSVESPTRVRTELFTNVNVNSEYSPGDLSASFGTTSNVLLSGPAAFAAAGDDTTAVLSPRASPTALVRSDMSAMEISGNLSSLSAQQPSGEINAHQQSMASTGDYVVQPTSSLLLLQVIPLNEDVDAIDGSVEFGRTLGSSQWFGTPVLAQTTAAVLIATYFGAIFAGLAGSSVIFTLASFALTMGSLLQRFAFPRSDKTSFETTLSTMSSSRENGSMSKRSDGRRKGDSSVGKAQPSVLRREMSRLSSHFSYSVYGGMVSSSFVAPLMG
ncbi:hypothetical protein TARUN_2564 [Trichoderma arundinaceum]|uniref:Transcription factor Cys6 n=1 Tax=Trichoderma arundinaceum TaxID=490622 RepID=A0A395NU94_TRIAR|nr:hypothetical protein TARUN_2564 [Trichoderma arundinaceum]